MCTVHECVYRSVSSFGGTSGTHANKNFIELLICCATMLGMMSATISPVLMLAISGMQTFALYEKFKFEFGKGFKTDK